jgi:flagellar protein FliO/FliZ
MRTHIKQRWLSIVVFSCLLFNIEIFAADVQKQTAKTITSGDVSVWAMALLIVLSIFFACVWALRKLNASTANSTEKMHVVGGIPLGLREKVILLQVGKKQLVLGITPGRIETLHVLEGDDCLTKEPTTTTAVTTNGFAQKLLQAISSRPEYNKNEPS